MNELMPLLIDANLTAGIGTQAGEASRSPEEVGYHVELTKRGLLGDTPSLFISLTFVPSDVVYLETAGRWVVTSPNHDRADVNEARANAWATLERRDWLFGARLHGSTQASKPTSTTLSSVAKLLRRQHRDERLRRMSPEARATYDRIRTLREEIGPLDFDIIKALRVIRDGD